MSDQIERIETTQVNRRLRVILEQVAKGKTFILTRYGKDVAMIGPPPDPLADEPPDEPPAAGALVGGGPPTSPVAPAAAAVDRDELLRKVRERR